MSDDGDSSEVLFSLLGPLAVTVGGAPVVIGAAKMRIVLAALLLRRGEVVPVDVLVERLWDEHPPPGARNAVQTYIRRLRTTLGAAGRLIATGRMGYYLDVPAAAVDVDRFRSHIELARSAASAGDVEVEERELRAGLGLWRGTPLSDVPSESLQRDEVPRLLDEQSQAVEHRIDLDLRLGRHSELLAELRALTSAHPLREVLWRYLMLALYRGRRQAEALSAFREVSTLLRDELGVDPSGELTELHRRILVADPALDLLRPVPRPAEVDAWVMARQLPPEVVDFVGRVELVERIASVVAPERAAGQGLPLVVLSGPPGVGKTELAVHVAYRLASQFPDGQLFVNLRGFSPGSPVRPEEVLGGFLRAIGVPADRVPLEPDERVALFRSLMTGRKVLLVLDNAGSPDDVRPLLPGNSACAVIVTSRDSLFGLSAVNGAARVPVDPVTGHEAEALLSRILGADRAGAESAAVAELATACGFLPLALRIAASNLAATPGQSVAGHVQELRSDDRLAAFTIEGDDQASVRAAFDLSYRALKPEIARLFRRLSLVPGPDFDRYAAAALAGVGPPQARRMLVSLTTANLIQHHGTDRYQFHDLIRDYASSQAGHDDAETRLAAARRLLDYFVHATDAAGRLLYSDFPLLPKAGAPPDLTCPTWTSPLDALGWLETEMLNLVAIVRDPALQESGAPVWLLADSLLGYFVRQRQDAAWPATLRSALTAAERAGEPSATSALHRGLGRLHYRRNEYTESQAAFLRSAELSRGIGDRAGEGRDVIGLGSVAFELQDYIEAARCFEEALPLLRGSGDLKGEATALVYLGITLIMIGRADQGREWLIAGRTESEKLGLLNVSLKARAGLAMFRSWCGDFENATAEFASVLSSWTDLGYVQGQAETRRNLAEIHLEFHRTAEAVAAAEQALAQAEQVDAKWVAMGAKVTLSEAHLRSGDVESAHRALTDAAALTAAGCGYWYPFVQLGFAACHRAGGDQETAAKLALDVAENQRPRVRARAHTEVALASMAVDDYPRAMEHAELAREISATFGYRPDIERALDIMRQARASAANHFEGNTMDSP